MVPPGSPGACLQSDTWCSLDEPDLHFYDGTLVNNTVARLQYASHCVHPFMHTMAAVHITTHCIAPVAPAVLHAHNGGPSDFACVCVCAAAASHTVGRSGPVHKPAEPRQLVDTTRRHCLATLPLRYAAELYARTGRPFAIFSGFARPHAPWRMPQRFWDMYKPGDVKAPRHVLPPDGMPGIAWYSQGFYNASNGSVYMPSITARHTPHEQHTTPYTSSTPPTRTGPGSSCLGSFPPLAPHVCALGVGGSSETNGGVSGCPPFHPPTERASCNV